MAKKRILARVKYNVKAHKDFYLFHLTHKSSFIYLMPILMLFMLLLMMNNGGGLGTFIGFIIFTALLMGSYLFFSVNMNVKRDYKERKNTVETIEITKDNITRVEERDGVVTGRDIIGWYQIMNAYEVKKYFYIYTSNDRGFIIQKNEFIEGTSEQMRDYLQKYLKPSPKGKIPFKQSRSIKKEIKYGLSK